MPLQVIDSYQAPGLRKESYVDQPVTFFYLFVGLSVVFIPLQSVLFGHNG